MAFMEPTITLQIWIYKKVIQDSKIMSCVENTGQGNSKHVGQLGTTIGVLKKRVLKNKIVYKVRFMFSEQLIFLSYFWKQSHISLRIYLVY